MSKFKENINSLVCSFRELEPRRSTKQVTYLQYSD